MKSFRLALIPASFGTIFCVSVLAQDPSTVSAPTVEVISTTPVPGLEMSKEKVPGNVQTISGKTIAAARPVTLNSLLDDNVGSINVNNYQGNPFQPDVTYRGFSASPLLGTPQGLSVYLDSVRINEPFGDVVAWDLIPINAISRVDVIPGSNPLYGLNTLGGAIALHTKDGFTDPGGHVEASWGSWNRRNVWAEVGGSRDNFGLYLNANHFEENGWRDFSPSSVDQFFGKASVRTERTSLDLSVLYANTTLVGNGLTPLSILQQRWGGVFTVPDQTKNEVTQIALSGTQEIDSHNQIGGSAYYRRGRRSTLNGDFFDDFTDTNFDGASGTSIAPGTGTAFDPTDGFAPTGVFNRTKTAQNGEGAALQYTNIQDANRFSIGTTYDNSHVDYTQTAQLGVLDDNRTVQVAPGLFTFWPDEILSNAITGRYRTVSGFVTDTWSVRPTVHLTLSGRYNVTRVNTNLTHNVNAEQLADYTGVDQFNLSAETFTYRKFNPALGGTWNVTPSLTTYANLSQGSRVPSPIELGCANPAAPCTIPTALTDDPFLPQVVARTGELGARGHRNRTFNWNASVFRTNTKDDILFVSSPTQPQQGYFNSFGKTRRQGLELGLSGEKGRFSWQSAYTYLDATFQSPATLVNSANSSSDANGVYNVQSGDRIPGLPQHVFKISASYRATQALSVGLSLYAQSWQYVRGNENNQHQPGGTDADGRPFVGSGKSPGFATVNLRTRYEFQSGVSLFAEVTNLFDREYFTAGALGVNPFVPGAGGAVGTNGFNYNSAGWQNATAYAPGAPRGIWVGVAYSFGRSKTGATSD